jgi:hypothetical protein
VHDSWGWRFALDVPQDRVLLTHAAVVLGAALSGTDVKVRARNLMHVCLSGTASRCALGTLRCGASCAVRVAVVSHWCSPGALKNPEP